MHSIKAHSQNMSEPINTSDKQGPKVKARGEDLRFPHRAGSGLFGASGLQTGCRR